MLVTENVKDFAAERDFVIVCVLKSRLPAQEMSGYLADLLDAWASSHPDPYVGLHWPKSEHGLHPGWDGLVASVPLVVDRVAES